MSKTHKRVLEATFTNSKTGASVTLNGEHAYAFKRQFASADQIISYYDETTGKWEHYNRDCICNVSYSNTQGEAYVKPTCTPLYCPPSSVIPPVSSTVSSETN